jgi:hypothetical protein
MPKMMENAYKTSVVKSERNSRHLGVFDVGWKQMLGTDFEEMGWQNGDSFMRFRV